MIPSPADLVGRDAEVLRLEQVVSRADRSGAAVVVSGEAGIGKTALLSETIGFARDRGLRVMTATGAPSETHLAFAGLHQLLRHALDDVADALPEQRDTILRALQPGTEGGPTVFQAAMAVLDVLGELAATRPVLVVVDDAQWLDPPTWSVLVFVARRLDSDPVALVLGVRDDGADEAAGAVMAQALAADFQPLPLSRLDEEAAATLLDRTAPTLDALVRRRLLAEAAGNPLALIELPTVAEHLVDGGSLPTWIPLTRRLEAAFSARISSLPPVTQTVLLVIALNDGDSIGEALAAASIVLGTPATLDEVDPAAHAGLLDVQGDRVRFSHPLVRSAVHQAAGPAQREAGHAALAEVLSTDPDRQVWHRAAAANGPDEEIAAALMEAAEKARRAGGTLSALTTFERSVRLSPEPARRAARALRAAEFAFELGHPNVVGGLLADIDASALERLDAVRLEWLREVLRGGPWTGDGRAPAFVELSTQLRLAGDLHGAVEALREISLRLWWSNPSPETRRVVLDALDAVPGPSNQPHRIITEAMAAPIERGSSVLDRLADLDLATIAPDPGLLTDLAHAATAVGDHPAASTPFRYAIAEARRQGRLALLARALAAQAWADVQLGLFRRVDVAAEEATRLASETEQPLWTATAQLAAATVGGRRGDEDRTEDLIAQAERVFLAAGANPLLALVQMARGTAALAAGRHDDALDQLLRIYDPSDPAYHLYARTFVVPDLVESAVRAGRAVEARAIVAELAAVAEQTRSPILLAGLRFAGPLLAEDDHTAAAAFDAALSGGLASWPFHRARLHLAHGTWLRRHQQPTLSRAPLRVAMETFESLGAAPWAARARQELRASGESQPVRALPAWERLTNQELQIAGMAAQGLSNRQIGERLFLSHRTVGGHLYRIYPKLGIASRAHLAAALAGATSPDPVADAGAGDPPQPWSLD